MPSAEIFEFLFGTAAFAAFFDQIIELVNVGNGDGGLFGEAVGC